jgi:hypothetical protein
VTCISSIYLEFSVSDHLTCKSEACMKCLYWSFWPTIFRICSTPQINTWTADWIEFYSKHRLGYQLELISQRFGDSAIYEKGTYEKGGIDANLNYVFPFHVMDTSITRFLPFLFGYLIFILANIWRACNSSYHVSFSWAGQRLIENMHPLFDGAVIEPCLLHGDLWSGNISSDTNGDPVILDPACYCM